ncbi:MAG: hypothetical protein IJP16_09985 [Clostridia bacterium]|nr:hypothetical protein [Clostridia bacterium]
MILTVKGQSLDLEGGIIAEGSVEFASFTLECDSSWDGYSRTVRFRHTSQEDTYDVAGVVDGRAYYVPSEVLVRGSVFVSVLGTKGASQISTTELAGFFVEGTVDSGKVPTVTENAYAQYVSQVNGIAEHCEELAETVVNACKEAEEYAFNASSSEERCRESAVSCRDYATLCERVSAETSGAEQQMSIAVERVRDSVNALLSHDHSLSVAENERHASENERRASEETRKACESERESNEQKRASAEAERISAERGRVAGELERESRVAGLESEMALVSDKLFGSATAIVGKEEGTSVAISDAEKKPPLYFGVSGVTAQDGVPSIHTPVQLVGTESVRIHHYGKNYIPYPYAFSNASFNGVVFTANADGGVYVSGATSGSKATVELCESNFTLDAGRYVVSGGTSLCGVYVYSMDEGGYIARSNGGDAEFVLDTLTRIKVRLYIFSDTSLEQTVYPMIRAFGTDNEYSLWKRKMYSRSISSPLYTGDRIILSEYGGTARVERAMAEVTLNGDERLELYETDGEYSIYSVTLEKDAFSSECSCTHLPYSQNGDGECCWCEIDKLFFKVKTEDFPTASSFLAFVGKERDGGMPIKAVYTLLEPEVESIDEIGLVLDADFNRFICDKGVLTLEYIRDTNTVFEAIIDTLISLDARVSLLEV